MQSEIPLLDEGSRRAEVGAVGAGQGRTEKHLPGELGIWMFILGDMLVFGMFFIVFMHYRALDMAVFLQSQATLNLHLGAINTLLLLTSSWFVVRGVQSARTDPTRPVGRWFALAFLCGAGFGVIKIFEYGEKIGAGITLTTNDFYMYYFVFTGIHFMHVLIGMGILFYMWIRTRAAVTGKGDIAMLESGATFWHLVDLLWIVLFPLLYLIK
ncbi:MAG: cytochrome c oxidase subunit 3 family protein [Pseudomonadota bacterium]|nr:cytochrome c oxidase subunit 3 family protein [Pseudomonadota bacterium]